MAATAPAHRLFSGVLAGLIATVSTRPAPQPAAHAETAPAYVTTWPYMNGNEYAVAVASRNGRVIVGVQLFSTQGYVVEHETDGDGVAYYGNLLGPPGGVALAPDGSTYASVTRLNIVQRLSAPAATWGDTGTAPGEFRFIDGIAIDVDDFIYAVDRGNDRIQKLQLDGTPVLTWGVSGSGPGELETPVGVAVDGLGHVYVTDNGGDKIVKYTTQGIFVTEWGDSGAAPGQLARPAGVAANGQGRVYVVDANQRIQKFSAQGDFLASWGVPDSAESGPIDVAVDGEGGIYVAEPFRGIHKFQEAAPAEVRERPSSRLAIESIAPNPFRNRLVVRWAQPASGPTDIVLADVKGRRVATLAEGSWSAGRHEVATSLAERTSPLAPGVYWIRVRHSGVETARPVVLLR